MDSNNFVPSGSPVEVGLLNFSTSQGVSVHDRFTDRADDTKFKLMAWIPFSSERKVMTVAYIDLTEDESKVKVIMKGAPEKVLDCCTASFDNFGNEGQLDRNMID